MFERERTCGSNRGEKGKLTETLSTPTASNSSLIFQESGASYTCKLIKSQIKGGDKDIVKEHKRSVTKWMRSATGLAGCCGMKNVHKENVMYSTVCRVL